MKIERCPLNPILTCEDVKPSSEEFKVVGIFNCGTATYHGETILLCRVAECVRDTDEKTLGVPVVVRGDDGDSHIEVKIFSKDDPKYDFSDSRKVTQIGYGKTSVAALTSLSHLRVARSKDGIHFTVEDHPFVMLDPFYEEWGMEDPRITQIGDKYYIDYVSVASFGVTTSLLCTRDFENFERLGVIFAPENKDVAIFPEKIGSLYYALNRPVPDGIGQPNIWLANSPDLIHWGDQKLLTSVSTADSWDSTRIGGGAVPVRTSRGWLVIYHGADRNDNYFLNAMLLDLENPTRILGKLSTPLLKPEEEYERIGFYDNVVFSCGVVAEEDVLRIYYGAADDKICMAEASISELLDALLS